MVAIRQNAFAINLAIQSFGFGSVDEINIDYFYWTSTLWTNSTALTVGGFYYTTFEGTMPNQNYVRAIRKF